jgi:hypothetical protein
MKAPINIKNIISYITGNVRYALYNSRRMSFLLPIHIKEQIEMRIKEMDQECYKQGSCIICGCQTPHLQMANKACDKPCYPTMMNRKDWKRFSAGVPALDPITGFLWWLKRGQLKHYYPKKAKENVGN